MKIPRKGEQSLSGTRTGPTQTFSGVACSSGRAGRSEDQNEEENEENLRKNERNTEKLGKVEEIFSSCPPGVRARGWLWPCKYFHIFDTQKQKKKKKKKNHSQKMESLGERLIADYKGGGQ